MSRKRSLRSIDFYAKMRTMAASKIRLLLYSSLNIHSGTAQREKSSEVAFLGCSPSLGSQLSADLVPCR